MTTDETPKTAIKSISEFISHVAQIIKDIDKSIVPIYRGQADASWMVGSSLERTKISDITISAYFKYINNLKSLINPCISRRFEKIPSEIFSDENNDGSYDDISSALQVEKRKEHANLEQSMKTIEKLTYKEMEYLTYLRHHGFPTPIVDWTLSMFVALFFACEDFVTSKADGKVFIYKNRSISSNHTHDPQNYGNLNLSIESNETKIIRINRYVETSKRHLAQQAEYLFPVTLQETWMMIPFMNAIKNCNCESALSEIIIDGKAKERIVSDLRKMNINRYTLYLDEDSLIRNFTDEFVLNNRRMV
jgi:hypothetical protein